MNAANVQESSPPDHASSHLDVQTAWRTLRWQFNGQPLCNPPGSFESAMQFEHSITVRSQPGMNADYGRALERVAFFPGVTHAILISQDVESVTIGYNGSECVGFSRPFRADLEADDLTADGPLWELGAALGEHSASNITAVSGHRSARVRLQRTAVALAFERRS